MNWDLQGMPNRLFAWFHTQNPKVVKNTNLQIPPLRGLRMRTLMNLTPSPSQHERKDMEIFPEPMKGLLLFPERRTELVDSLT
jgi:hypothetical protein